MARFGEVAANVAAKVGSFVAGLYSLVKLILIATIAFSVAVASYFIYDGVKNGWQTITSPITWVTGGKSEPEKPVDQVDLANQIDCFTAIVAKDVEGELAVHVGTVRNEIADATLRLLAKYPSLTMCDVMKKGLTFFPTNWDHVAHARFWRDRNLVIIKNGQTTSAWTSAQVIARAKYGTKPPTDKCATNYLRAAYNYMTTPFSGESEGAAMLLATMDPDPKLRDLGFKTTFLCEKK